MSHAKSLRVIGQILEAAKVETFELEKHGQRYLVWSAALTKEGKLILRNALQDNDFASENNRQRYRMSSVSIQLIFHVSMRGHKKDEEISLLQLRGRQRCCLTSYVVWAIILTESR